MNARLVMPRRTRTLGAVGTGLMAVLLAWSPVLAAVSWGSTYKASTDYAYGWSDALTRTVTSTGAAYDPAQAPRDLQFMRNTNHGSSTAWSPRKTDFLGANYIDRPSITAAGSRVYITYTDSSGGEIRLQRSVDYGMTWEYLGAIGATNAGGHASCCRVRKHRGRGLQQRVDGAHQGVD